MDVVTAYAIVTIQGDTYFLYGKQIYRDKHQALGKLYELRDKQQDVEFRLIYADEWKVVKEWDV